MVIERWESGVDPGTPEAAQHIREMRSDGWFIVRHETTHGLRLIIWHRINPACRPGVIA